MEKINWFPGHMSKALGQIKAMLKNVDVVIYVLDGRAPITCINPSLSTLSGGKPVLYVISKTDLADENKLDKIIPSLKGEKTDVVKINSTLSGAGKIIKTKILTLAKEKIEKYKAKGIKTCIRAIVVGVPNCGKSTLVNNLCGKAKAVTGDRPGVTKSALWLNIGDNIELCDTPGTLYPNISDQNIALKLVYIGSIKDEIIEPCFVAESLISLMQKLYPERLQERYKGAKTLEEIARFRGFVLGKGELDEERAAAAVLDDLRKGRLGKITLD